LDMHGWKRHTQFIGECACSWSQKKAWMRNCLFSEVEWHVVVDLVRETASFVNEITYHPQRAQHEFTTIIPTNKNVLIMTCNYPSVVCHWLFTGLTDDITTWVAVCDMVLSDNNPPNSSGQGTDPFVLHV
jgi:hypothetical protein